ncbi:fasciclin-1-like isoform X2 [Ornithodoros turicata]|uniref:fasciclin-1-like isoform X2 n=1 Tax=Ornithodoros turicata TaxID=34597 RepID=UPI00313872F1
MVQLVSLNLADENLPSSIPTIAQGSPLLYLSKTDDRLFFVNNAKVIRKRELHHSGQSQKLYIIDEVLEAFVPTQGITPNALAFLNQPTIYGLKEPLSYFSTRVSLTDEKALFSDEKSHTFFMPVGSSEQYNRMRTGQIDNYVVKGHVIPNRVLFTRTMRNETYMSAAWDENVKVELSLANQTDSSGAEYTLFAQSNTMSTDPQRQKGVVLAKIVKPNICVKNGVVHLIEKPLMVVDTAILDLLERERHGRLEDFMRLVDYSPDFRMDLESNQLKTIFAPTNEALKVIPSRVLDTLKANTSGLTKLLRLHMIKSEAVTSDIIVKSGNGRAFERESASSRRMLYMRVVGHDHGRILTVEGGGVNATAVQGDIGATNGVVHIIDRVLGMPSHTIYEKIHNDPELKDTLRFSQHKGWIDTLRSTDRRYTFFAPSDKAWQDLRQEMPSEYLQLSMDKYAYHAEKIMERHLIVNRELTEHDLESVNSIETMRGKMDVRNINGKIHLMWEGRDAVIVRPDVQATNGVIHVISKVMMMKRDMTSAAAVPGISGTLLLSLMLMLRTVRLI